MRKIVVIIMGIVLITSFGMSEHAYYLHEPTFNPFRPTSSAYNTIILFNDTEVHQIAGDSSYYDMKYQDINKLMATLNNYQKGYEVFGSIIVLLIVIIAGILLVVIKNYVTKVEVDVDGQEGFTLYIKKKELKAFKEYFNSLTNADEHKQE
jgi:hypothetical protein